MKPNTNSDAPRPPIPGHRGWAVAVMVFCATSLAGCILDEVEPNGSCWYGDSYVACQADTTNNRFDYRGYVDPRGFVSADDRWDTWVFRSLVSGPQDVWLTVTSGGYAYIAIMICDAEPCDGDTTWFVTVPDTMYGVARFGEGKTFIGSFDATENAHYLLRVGGGDPVNYQVSLRARGASTGCTTDTDCVPATCCHPSACVPYFQRPICGGACNSDCVPCTLDCTQGYCACQNGQCTAVLTSSCP